MRNVMALMTALLTSAGCTSLESVEVPAALRTHPDEKVAYWVPARGMQIYECRQRASGGGFEWVFVAPDAELLDAFGTLIGRHGAGPYWQSNDGSRVVGAVRAGADAPVKGAIPWLLLATKSNGSAGHFSQVTSIQRVNTVGGIAPATGCAEESLGKTTHVPYSADYVFYTTH